MSNVVRIAVASTPPTSTVADGVEATLDAVRRAAEGGASVVCLPEAVIPGHRFPDRRVEDASPEKLRGAIAAVAAQAAAARIHVVAGVEEPSPHGRLISAVVIGADGRVVGRQRKVQLAPVEERWYVPGSGRAVFRAGPLAFGVTICHEGFKHPETVRALARAGAQVVFHPHYEGCEDGPVDANAARRWCAGTYHEHAQVCRALENEVYIAGANYALTDQFSATAVIAPDGGLVGQLPYGEPGVLITEVDLDLATGSLAGRYRPEANLVGGGGGSPAP